MKQLDLNRIQCVIFDLDGTLVDSEILSLQGYCDTVPDLDWDVNYMVANLRGFQFHKIVEAMEGRVGHKLAEDYETTYRAHVAELFEAGLQAFPDVLDVVPALKTPKCIASAGPIKKMRHSLGLTGLLPHFEDRIFSSYVVKSWKPEPGLFLHAAKTMGYAPENCLVVEDSEVGIEAAKRAGMQHLLHVPEGHHVFDGYDGAVLNRYRDLPLS
ncbi:haloacid dehalogenase superfamily, subfamily IA, variant 3 with third motif having DD or ED [Cohaesibacter marisflavi]|uniref:Haloacid dehalogenase superfamily, subfamily IA, variant 3 with third motif having DD or ED n=1 Tax=Cohaesibacter marisflavi TaxID=655353 RepID=A0A1I5E8Q3_9HYPH|nr:HAD-IA family hydrolase [Cohaesibacter marisflavi]SFO07733.1 haloacid dehalogenase superfamily, subfamily IA, variant 3 with third motif having DD or ED [Cohaesibacter marisflavi]